MEEIPTKNRILYASVRLFSELGYDKVSMRDIAAEVGIKAASIYNHFSSKKAILKSVYEFYDREQRLVCPDLAELLKMAETEPVERIFDKINFEYRPDVRDSMSRALLIASRGITRDEDGGSEKFLRRHHFDMVAWLAVPVLNRLIELGRIEPLDVDTFSGLLAYYGYSAAVLNHTSMKIEEDQWKKGLAMLFSAIKPIPGKETDQGGGEDAPVSACGTPS